MRVIFQDDDYTLLMILAGVDTLESRPDQLPLRLSLLSLLTNTLPGPSASEVTTLWRYTNLFIIIIILHTQCAARVIVFALSAAGLTRHVGDRTTAPS